MESENVMIIVDNSDFSTTTDFGWALRKAQTSAVYELCKKILQSNPNNAKVGVAVLAKPKGSLTSESCSDPMLLAKLEPISYSHIDFIAQKLCELPSESDRKIELLFAFGLARSELQLHENKSYVKKSIILFIGHNMVMDEEELSTCVHIFKKEELKFSVISFGVNFVNYNVMAKLVKRILEPSGFGSYFMSVYIATKRLSLIDMFRDRSAIEQLELADYFLFVGMRYDHLLKENDSGRSLLKKGQEIYVPFLYRNRLHYYPNNKCKFELHFGKFVEGENKYVLKRVLISHIVDELSENEERMEDDPNE